MTISFSATRRCRYSQNIVLPFRRTIQLCMKEFSTALSIRTRCAFWCSHNFCNEHLTPSCFADKCIACELTVSRKNTTQPTRCVIVNCHFYKLTIKNLSRSIANLYCLIHRKVARLYDTPLTNYVLF